MFLDEIDKICARSEMRGGGDVSREGVQRDLLPLIEGTTVATKHGPVKTDHILFIASGAFHTAKPSDLLPELQGRLPIRVELKALTRDDFRRILTEPEASLIKQYVALLATENVTLDFTEDGIDAIADLAAQVNARVENIGARRLQTIMERVLDEISSRFILRNLFPDSPPGARRHNFQARWDRVRTGASDNGVHFAVAQIFDRPHAHGLYSHLRARFQIDRDMHGMADIASHSDTAMTGIKAVRPGPKNRARSRPMSISDTSMSVSPNLSCESQIGTSWLIEAIICMIGLIVVPWRRTE